MKEEVIAAQTYCDIYDAYVANVSYETRVVATVRAASPEAHKCKEFP